MFLFEYFLLLLLDVGRELKIFYVVAFLSLLELCTVDHNSQAT